MSVENDPTQTSDLFASVAGCKPSQWSYAVFNSIDWLSTCAYGAHRFLPVYRLRIALDFVKRLMAGRAAGGRSTAPPALLRREERNTLEAVL